MRQRWPGNDPELNETAPAHHTAAQFQESCAPTHTSETSKQQIMRQAESIHESPWKPLSTAKHRAGR